MMSVILVIHAIICILLIGIILIQAGRGGGLVEGFSSMESMFGPKTNVFLTRTTTVLSVLFFITCLSLALLSARQGRSLLRNLKSGEETVNTNVANVTNVTQSLPVEGLATQNATTSEAPKSE